MGGPCGINPSREFLKPRNLAATWWRPEAPGQGPHSHSAHAVTLSHTHRHSSLSKEPCHVGELGKGGKLACMFRLVSPLLRAAGPLCQAPRLCSFCPAPGHSSPRSVASSGFAAFVCSWVTRLYIWKGGRVNEDQDCFVSS